MTPATTNITVLLRSRESAEATVREIVAAQIAREKLIAARDLELERVGAKHNPDIDSITANIELNFELLEDWAENNGQEFVGAKSMTINGHRFGWRTGNPTVKARGKLSLKTILARLIEAGGTIRAQFVREKSELNKEAILELHRVAEGRSPALEALNEKQREEAKLEAVAALKAIGVMVQQVETFYFEPDRDGQPDIRLAGAEKEVA